VLTGAIEAAYGRTYDVRWVYDPDEVAARLADGTYVYGDYCTGEIFGWDGTQTLLLDTALNISMQSSVQIAAFVTPALVFVSYGLGHPLDIVFTPFEILAVGLTVAVFAYLVLDGETNWYVGVQLLAVYAIIAIALYFLPMSPQPVPAEH